MGEFLMRPTDRRTVLAAAGVAVAAATVAAAAQPKEISGTVTFESGKAIPEGRLNIHLEDRALQDKSQLDAAKTRIQSDGVSRSIAFSLPVPAGMTASATQQIVARLERADGHLLARGSAERGDGSPVSLTLNTVMY
jgi:uncharacterized lipoprotein YbaY